MRRPFTVALAGLALVVGAVGPASATAPSASPVYRFADGSVVAKAESTLLRGKQGTEFRVDTSDLPAGHTISVWLVIFNEPQNCTHPTHLAGLRCGPGDLPPFGGNDSAVTSVVYGAGHPVGDSGRSSFAGRLATGDTTGALWGPGLVNPTTAEIHLVVNDGAAFGCPSTCLQFSPHGQ